MVMVELGLAIRALQDRTHRARLDAWRRRSVATALPQRAHLALSLIPPVGVSPTYLTPAVMGRAEEGLDQVRAAPQSQIRAQTARLSRARPVPSWARHLADDPALYRQLSDGLGDLYSVLLAPYWDQATDLFAADRSLRMRQLMDGGVESLLSQANPHRMRWAPPVLEIRMPNGIEDDLYLEGRGVCLVPSIFATRTTVDDEAQPQPTVCFPASAEQPLRTLTVFGAERTDPASAPALSALLGQTRSAVLHILAEHPGCSTKELATLAGVAPASASEHATVLRDAGLIQTVRHRNRALHTATSLGVALLNGTSGQG